jgi:excisionase family DNA binding protein
MTSKDKRLVLSIEEAAERLGLSRVSAYKAAKSGQLPPIRFGRLLKVPTRALERMLEEVGR